MFPAAEFPGNRGRAAAGPRWEKQLEITLNGQRREVPEPLTVAQLLGHLGTQAGVRGRRGQSRPRYAGPARGEGAWLREMSLEIVTLVGGGSRCRRRHRRLPPLQGRHAHGPEPALRRHGEVRDARADARLPGGQRRRGGHGCGSPRAAASIARGGTCSIISTRSGTRSCPNTAGCFSAEEALRTARLGRELLEGLGESGRRLGQARGPGRHAHALARPGRHARGDPGAGRRGVSGALLHQRRPGHGPPAQGGRGRRR